MWNRCKRVLRPRPPKSRKALEATTDIFFADSGMEEYAGFAGNESCITEHEKFVGTTARFEEDGRIVPLRKDLQIKGYIAIPVANDGAESIQNSSIGVICFSSAHNLSASWAFANAIRDKIYMSQVPHFLFRRLRFSLPVIWRVTRT